jgi:hypothetical protein
LEIHAGLLKRDCHIISDDFDPGTRFLGETWFLG